MKINLSFFLLCFFPQLLLCHVYISEIINNTNQVVSLAYPNKLNISMNYNKSINSGNPMPGEIKIQTTEVQIIVPPQSIASLEGAYIPNGSNDSRGYNKTGITIGFGTGILPITPSRSHGSYGTFGHLRLRNSWLEILPKDKFCSYADINFIKISTGIVTDESKYILEISLPEKIIMTPRSNETLDRYKNPGNLSAQDLLHQAIINNSVEDIKNALKLGANINEGIGNQPPLLMAILSEKYKAAVELLENGANPNINYKSKSLFIYLIHPMRIQLASLFLDKGLNLSTLQKQEAIELILDLQTQNYNDYIFNLIKKLNYDITNNFKEENLDKNKWYNLLVRHFMGTNKGIQFGHTGLPAPHLIPLLLKNNADPNQIFKVTDSSTWTPILLIIDNYTYASNRGRINEEYYQETTKKILTSLLQNGANINQEAKPNNINESGLSFALKYDTKGSIIEFLTKNGASIEQAIELFLKSGGSPNKEILYPKKSLLFWAIENNNPQAVSLLIKGGAYKNQETLKFAIFQGNSEIIQLLMAEYQKK